LSPYIRTKLDLASVCETEEGEFASAAALIIQWAFLFRPDLRCGLIMPVLQDPSLRSTVPLPDNSSDKRQELRPLRALHNLLGHGVPLQPSGNAFFS
jgi:hypothetical protein